MNFSILVLSFALSFLVGYIVFSQVGEDESADSKLMRDRLRKIKNKSFDTTTSKRENKLVKAIVSDENYKYELIAKVLNKYAFVHVLKAELKTADIKIDVTQYLFMMMIIFCVGTVLGIIMGMGVLAILVGLVIGVVPPVMMLKMKKNKRLNMFSQQLPEALGLIASSLRAGHSLLSAFQMVASELPAPVSTVFRNACEDMNLGRSVKEALDGMQENVPGSVDLRFFITAVLIQREIGGNLAEVLDSLNDTIRERFKLLGQIKSQTAQARLSGIVLACAPAVICGIIYVLNPAYMEPLFTSLLGKMAVGLATFLGVVGFLVIKKITTIRV